MIKKTLITFVILLQFASASNAQDVDYLLKENRSGQLFFKAGTEYRITPLPYDLPTIVPVNVDAQNSGFAVAYSLDMFLTKNLSLGFSNSFRYDYLGGDFDDIATDFGAEPSNRGLIMDFHFYLDYHFKIFKESELYIRLGRSLANRGTQLNVKESFFDDDGNLLFAKNSTIDLSYEPWNFGIGWKKRKTELLLGFFTSGISEYFEEPESFIVPYFKFSYNLGRL